MLKMYASHLFIYQQPFGFFWVNGAYTCNKELQMKTILKFWGGVTEVFLYLSNVLLNILPLFLKDVCWISGFTASHLTFKNL